MKKSRKKVVALVDNNQGGHHREYLIAQIESLLRLGKEVLVVSWLGENEFFEGREKASEKVCFFELQIPMRRFLRLLGREWGGRMWGLSYFGILKRKLRRIERETGKSIELVFFSCIYDREFNFSRSWWKGATWSWAGLYLHARGFRMPGSPNPQSGVLPAPEKFLRGDKLAGISLLDEAAIPWMTELIGQKAYFHPDLITDLRLDPHFQVLPLLKSAADGRKIVILAGHLVATKGVSDFIALSKMLADSNCLFAFVGAIAWNSLSEADVRFLQQVEQGKISNCFSYFKRTSPQEFNSVVNCSDLVFACYRSFPNSSNVMGKAAAFGKPVMVSDGFLMAERCREFSLGFVVSEGDVSEMAEKISQAVTLDSLHSSASGEGQKRYVKAHHCSRLDQMFLELL